MVAPHPQDVDLACPNCGSPHVYADMCDACGLCSSCDELAEDCCCEHPTASERYYTALEASL